MRRAWKCQSNRKFLTGRSIGLLVSVILLMGALTAQVEAAAFAQREVLPSGMVLLVAERPGVPIVAATLTLQAGAVFDPPAKPGVANLTAIMLSQGTTTRTAPQISEAIEFVGGSLSVESGTDTARLSFSFLSKDLDLALDLMGDLLTNPTFPPAELAKKIPEVLAGIKRNQEDPGTVSYEAFMALVYGSHPYTPVIAGGKIFVGGRRPKQGLMTCLDERTGKPLWQWQGPARSVPDYIDGWLIGIRTHPEELGVCSSPVVEGDRLYFVSNRFDVLCMDVRGHTAGPDAGKARVVWSLDMWDKLGVIPCDATNGSPLIDGDLGWYYHTGPHAATPADWRVFLQFLDKYFTEEKS